MKLSVIQTFGLFLFSLSLSGCIANFSPGRLVYGRVSSSSNAVCTQLAEALDTASYCKLASKHTSPTKFGSGTEDDPYTLCSPYQLNAIGGTAALMDKHIALGADLDMSCLSGNHTQIGDSTESFSGVFDGNSKEIRNWTYDDVNTDYVGVFRILQGLVKDLKIEDATVRGKNNVGILAGQGSGVLIRVSTTGTVSGTSYVGGISGYTASSLTLSTSSATVSGGSYVGGLVGGTGHVQISSSSFTGSVTATGAYAGGIIGATWGIVANSYSTASVTGTTHVGGLVGTSSYHIHNSYATGAVSGTTTVGGLVGSMTGATSSIKNSFSLSDITGLGGTSANIGLLYGTLAGSLVNSFTYAGVSCDADSGTGGAQACGTTATGSHALVSDFHDITNAPLSSWDFQDNTLDGTDDFWAEISSALPKVWNEAPASFTVPFSGEGTRDSPYLITSEAEFSLVGMNARLLEAHYRLTRNLDFTAVTFKQFGSEEAPFLGSFDGADFKIQSVTHTKTTGFTGIFGFTAFETIKDLRVRSSSFTGTTFVGGLVGYNFYGRVENCSSQVVSVNGTYHVGGLVGISSGTVIDSDSTATLSTVQGNAFGGLVGNNQGDIISSWASGDITNALTHTGGLVGINSGTIEDSFATGSVTTAATSAGLSNYGGMVGNHSGTIRRSYASGTVNGRNYSGGLVGNNSAGSSIEDSFSTGNVSGTGLAAKVGPLTGNSLATITNSYSLATSSCDSDTATGGVQACNALGTSTIALTSDLYSTSTAPLDQWDFTDVWISDGLSLPSHPY